MTVKEIVRDCDGTALGVGDRVIFGVDEPVGIIEQITESDADYDDELGRGVMITPRVTVRFPDGQHEIAQTHCTNRFTWADYPDGPDTYEFMADDLKSSA